VRSAAEILDAFGRVRRAQRAGIYAPHKPLLILWALGRVQRGEPRLTAFTEADRPLKQLLGEFGSEQAASTRHYPFWHLSTDAQGELWEVTGAPQLIDRPAGATPTLGELRQHHVKAGFAADVDDALRHVPGLLPAVAARVLDAYFPSTLHGDIAASVGLDLSTVPAVADPATEAAALHAERTRRRDPRFRERVLLAYEYRCCVCGFDLRIGNVPAGLEAAHIQWHQYGGPDIEPNGLSLCALHHKLFDLGAFTIEPAEFRVAFSEHAISGGRGMTGELQHHGRQILIPQRPELLPGREFLHWNVHQGPFRRRARPLTMPSVE